jgi:hypothetical protein
MSINKITLSEGNKLIAEFMGFNVLPVDSLSGKRYEVIDFEHGRIKVENLDVDCFYHTSWDWLFPVCIKIINLPLSQFNHNAIAKADLRLWKKRIEKINIAAPKAEMWQKVVEFLTWYNGVKF